MDKGITTQLYGNYRAKVISNKDRENFGRVLIWIPDLMQNIPQNQGIWARPANNPAGGRNRQEGTTKNYYAGTTYIPPDGSWVFIFFEAGNINRPYYFAALDIQNAEILPENRLGTNNTDKWVIFKSHEGRTVVVSDDPDDARVEITGTKRQLTGPPSGDTASVYTIDGNQTTILLDERSGKQKLLIRTYKGDYFNIDIEDRKLYAEFDSDIEIKTNGSFKLLVSDDIDIKSQTGNVNITANTGVMNLKSADQMKQSSSSDFNINAKSNFNYSAGSDVNGLAGGNINHDGTKLVEQSGAAIGSPVADTAASAEPKGDRD